MSAVLRRGALAAAAALALALGSGSGQRAAAPSGFPDRPLRIIVPSNAGGVTDVMSRAVAQALSPVLGQPVVVGNGPGAKGSVGILAAARSAPDGCALTMGMNDTFAINPYTFKNLPYDPDRDFAPVTMVPRVPFELMAGPLRREIITPRI